MDLYEHYYPMSAFETAIREIYLRHAPILKGGLSAYTSQQLVNLREDMLPDIQALARQGKGFYQHPKPEALAEMLYASDQHCVASIVSPYYPRYDPVPWHISRYYEINCQLYGQSIVCIGNHTLLLEAGDVLIIPPGVWQTGGVFHDQGILRSFRIRSSEFQRNLSSLLDCDCPLSEFIRQTISGSLTAAWRLYHLGSQPSLGRWLDWLEEIYLNRDTLSCPREAGFLLHFFSDIERIAGAQAEQSLAQAADDDTAQILSFLQLHLRTITRPDLAANFNYSERQITRIIEKATGMNYAAYLRQSRLQRIAEMLLTTNQSITEIVTSVGYKNNAYFYQHFRNMFGCSPLEYREQNHAMALL